MNSNRELVEYLVKSGVLKRREYIESFLRLDRKDFMWQGYEKYAYEDTPAPLGDTGQTISAPHMNAYAMEILEIDKNDIILEVGAGSGYQAALIGMYIKTSNGDGHIYTVEFVEQLYEFAKSNINRVGLNDYVTVILGDGSLGWPPKMKYKLYNKILVSAAASKPPKYLINQLKDEGKLLCPIGPPLHQSLYLFVRKGNIIDENKLFPVAFVPLKEWDND
ncbi:TPA: protein-L-isoaspartate O-methyltransferase [Candidatus Geothermarchaeota archaeon]|nr:protein-L-isoaspartate O-methyltransferase [Candidatus Geothermarchaeota archaeon]